MGETAFNIWMVLPFIWGGIGVAIIGVACIRELVQIARSRSQGK